MSAGEAAVSPAVEVPRRYGRSVLVAGLRGIGRAWLPLLIVVIVNAIVQALLVTLGAVPGIDGMAIVWALVSLAIIVITYAVVAAAALESVDGKVSWTAMTQRLRAHWLLFVIWTAVVAVGVFLGLLLYTLPGVLIAALTVFIPVAAMDGQRDAFADNFAAIKARPGRWLITVVIMGAIVGFAWLFSALCGFFVGGWLGPLLVWLVFGVLLAWFTCAWAALFRSTPRGIGTNAPAS